MVLALLPAGLTMLPFLTHQTASTHLHNLLVQRAVQTCCFTSRQCRDNPTAQWLGEFAGHAGLEEFHGIDGLRVQWDEYLAALLAAPEEGITVQSALMRHRGLSPSNPYLQPTPMEYEHRVVPSVLADRVMAIACVIASEWADDLSLMHAENERASERHRQSVVSSGTGEGERRLTLPVFCDATRDSDPDNEESASNTPYRDGNYDLLKLLATRQALRGLLAEYDANAGRRRSSEFLHRFAAAHPLEGERPRHAADAWLEALLAQPPLINMVAAAPNTPSGTSLGGGGGGGGDGQGEEGEEGEGEVDSSAISGGDGGGDGALIDPHQIADQIMRRRVDIASCWREELRGVPESMLALKRDWLNTRLS